MNIYFGASITFDRSQLPIYKTIIATLKKAGHEVLSEHVADPKLQVGDGLKADELFKREAATVEKADLLIAEVTKPSWGTAFLMEHALKHNIPVLALFYKDAAVDLPMMIQGHPEFYVEHYRKGNITTVLKRSLKHFEQRQNISGKLIVIDGGDGAGKATQTRMLQEYFKEHHVKSQYISFPRYKTSFHGQHVGRFLTGEFNNGAAEISPYMSSLAFALDRLTAKDEIIEWLAQGYMVIADRYVSASMAHQTSKLPEAKRDEFIDWIYAMEYKEHKLPKEDIVLFLYVPVETAQRLLEEGKKEKEYAGGEKDEAESNIEHQRKSIEMYRQLSERFDHWEMISCVDSKGELLSKQQVHKKVLAVLKKRGIC